jgi:predicted AAA+ superfamily ATPase
VAVELKKIISLEVEPMNLYTWRLQSGQEIDFLIEKGNHFLAIEVKLGQHIERSVFSSFEILKKDLGDCLKMGVVLYGGEDIVVLGSQMIAIPYDIFFDSFL